jgi:type II secretory pathway pseudopilin PulG
MHARIPTRSVGRRVDAERGVGLVEVVVVVLIIAILGALVLSGRNTTKRAGSLSAARAAGASYHDAVEAFMRDHGGRTPVWNGGTDWPATPPTTSGVATSGIPAQGWGPINIGARGKPYLDNVPEAVRGGSVVLVNNGATTAAPGVRARVVYQRISDRRYRISIQSGTPTSWRTSCEFGTEGGSRC